MALPRATTAGDYAVDLYWLPLGAGGHSVRLNGRVYEAALSMLQRRRPLALSLIHISEPTRPY